MDAHLRLTGSGSGGQAVDEGGAPFNAALAQSLDAVCGAHFLLQPRRATAGTLARRRPTLVTSRILADRHSRSLSRVVDMISGGNAEDAAQTLGSSAGRSRTASVAPRNTPLPEHEDEGSANTTRSDPYI
jgi:hypothetical protein